MGGWFYNPSWNSGRALSLKEKEHKILCRIYPVPFKKHFLCDYCHKTSPPIRTSRKLMKRDHIMDVDTLYGACYTAYIGSVKISAKGPWDGSS